MAPQAHHHVSDKPLPWFRDATTPGKVALLTSAVLTGAIPMLGGAPGACCAL